MPEPRGIFKRLHRGFLNNRAVSKHRHAIGNAQGQLDIVRNQHHGAAFVGKTPQVIERVNGEIQIEAGRGLVCDDKARVVHKGAHEQHAPDHAAGQFVRIQIHDPTVQAI